MPLPDSPVKAPIRRRAVGAQALDHATAIVTRDRYYHENAVAQALDPRFCRRTGRRSACAGCKAQEPEGEAEGRVSRHSHRAFPVNAARTAIVL